MSLKLELVRDAILRGELARDEFAEALSRWPTCKRSTVARRVAKALRERGEP